MNRAYVITLGLLLPAMQLQAQVRGQRMQSDPPASVILAEWDVNRYSNVFARMMCPSDSPWADSIYTGLMAIAADDITLLTSLALSWGGTRHVCQDPRVDVWLRSALIQVVDSEDAFSTRYVSAYLLRDSTPESQRTVWAALTTEERPDSVRRALLYSLWLELKDSRVETYMRAFREDVLVDAYSLAYNALRGGHADNFRLQAASALLVRPSAAAAREMLEALGQDLEYGHGSQSPGLPGVQSMRSVIATLASAPEGTVPPAVRYTARRYGVVLGIIPPP